MTETFYRAAARTESAGDHDGTWHGRWHPDRERAEQQALRWAFERADPPDQVWLEQLINDRPVLVAVLIEVGDNDEAA